ncbi:MAG: hypothetical protein HKN19_19985 [Halioglobus sp.]|nr:hypothetical protein [Halioglobus sp.]
MTNALSLAPTNNLHRIWLLRLLLPFGGRLQRLLTGLLIAAVTWISLWLVSAEISRYELWFFSCLFAYSVVIFSRIVEQSERAVDEIQTITGLPAGQLAPLRHYVSHYTRQELIYNLIGALIAGSIHMTIIRTSYDTPLRELFSHRELYASQLGTMVAWLVLTFVISSLINNALAWARLGRQLDIDLLQPRAVCAIGRIAVLSTLSVIGAQVLFVFLMLESGWNWYTTFPGLLASSLPTMAMFFIPVWPLHLRLRRSKAEALARLDGRLGALGNVANIALDDANKLDELNRLLQLRREVMEASVWPFDTSNLVKIVLYVLLVPMTWVGAALVESVVDTFVD